MLWVDKYRPKTLEDLDYHDDIRRRLESLAKNPSSLPHLFFYGPSGAGKHTRISAFLGALFGPTAHKLKLTQRTFTTPNGKTIDIHMISSEHHMELSPGDAGINDRFVIQDVLKDIASSKNISSSLANMDGNHFGKKQRNNSSTSSISNTNSQHAKATEIKVVVLKQVDKLSRQAQAALRRTMEKYAASCRLILCCESPSKLIAPLRSRCLGIRVGAPTEEEVIRILKMVASKESLTLPNVVAVNIARDCNRNLRKALLMLEAAKVQAGIGSGNNNNSTTIHESQLLPTADWELYIRQLAGDITKEQSPQTLMMAREKLYELLVNCIPATIILKTLVAELLNNLDDSVKLQVIEWAAFYEHRLAMGSKDIFHLEAFIAKYMAIYKQYLNDLFS